MKTIISLLCILCMFGPANGQSGHGIIQGVVRGPSGDPIAEATVYAYDYNRIADRGARIDSTTDEQGRFVLRGLPPATYSVHAYKTADGYADTFFSFFDTGNKEAFQLVRVEGAGAKDVTLRLGPKCGVLKVAVTDWEGTPVPVSLAFFKGDDTRRMVFSTNVAAQGETLVPPVPFVVRVDSDGLESWTSGVLHPRPGESIPISLRLKGRASTGTIHVWVADSNAPAPGSTAYLTESGNLSRQVNGKADSDGNCIFRNLKPGTYLAWAFAEDAGYPDDAIPIFLSADKKRPIRLGLHGTVAVTVAPEPKRRLIQLSISDEEGGTVAALVNVTKPEAPNSAHTVFVEGGANLLAPNIPLLLEVRAPGFRVWRSELITPVESQPMTTLSVAARLRSER